MAILNINQFSERIATIVILCEKCSGGMEETPMNTFDAIKFIFGKKKIIKRYRCLDCENEILVRK